MRLLSRRLLALVGMSASTLVAVPSWASPYFQTNLVSDLPGFAQLTDASLKNPWGMSFSAGSPFWVSDQATNSSTLYRVVNGVVTKVSLTVGIPTTAGGPQGPTGQVNNNTSSFVLTSSTGVMAPANFIFANLNGTISAWNGGAGTTSVVKATTPGAVYTGLAIATSGSGPRLYAANGASGKIDVFDGSFAPVTTLPSTAFVNTDPRLAGLAPFNVQNIGGSIYVTYAAPGRAAQIIAGEGSGAVAVFDTNGALIRTVVAGSKLASPWGITLAPAGFGGFSGDLLIGNFSFVASEINAFDPVTGAFLGTIADQSGATLINSGLWGLAFGNGVSGDARTLYFTAGINEERNGLFGSIAAIPEPGTLALFAVGLVAFATRIPRRRRSGRLST